MKEIVDESEVKISSVLSYAKSTLFDNRLQNYATYFKVGLMPCANAIQSRYPEWRINTEEQKQTFRH